MITYISTLFRKIRQLYYDWIKTTVYKHKIKYQHEYEWLMDTIAQLRSRVKYLERDNELLVNTTTGRTVGLEEPILHDQLSVWYDQCNPDWYSSNSADVKSWSTIVRVSLHMVKDSDLLIPYQLSQSRLLEYHENFQTKHPTYLKLCSGCNIKKHVSEFHYKLRLNYSYKCKACCRIGTYTHTGVDDVRIHEHDPLHQCRGGIYILTAYNPLLAVHTVYVGQSEDIRMRFQSHCQHEVKTTQSWTDIVLFDVIPCMCSDGERRKIEVYTFEMISTNLSKYYPYTNIKVYTDRRTYPKTWKSFRTKHTT